jgi:hypothetical protein
VGVAVNVTEVPWHTLFWLTATETDAGRTGFTTIVIVLEVAGLPVMQLIPEVITTYTTSPFTGVYVYVGRLAPTGNVFLYHW